MCASLKMRLWIVAAGLSCLLAGYVVAQQVTEREREGGARQPGGAGQAAGQTDRATSQRREYTAQFRGAQSTAGNQSQEVERFLANCLLAKNQAEIEIGELAQQQAQTPEVKEFAQKMVQDHRQLVRQLQPVAGNQAAGSGGASPSLDATGQDDASRTTATARTADSNSAVNQLIEIERQITERHKEALRDELQQKQGVEFDKCFVGGQIAGHMHMLAALDVLQQQGPEQLQQIAAQAQPKVQEHLDHAKQLMKQLEGGAATNSQAERPSRTQR